MRILVVEDDYITRLQLKALFSVFGDVDAVPGGELALKMFEMAHKESVPYDIITMDIEMPGMRGQVVVQKIRDWEMEKNFNTASMAKIIMISIKDDPAEIASSFFKGGCDFFIKKPITRDKLRDAFEKINS